MHSVIDGRTDGRHDDVNSRSYCVAVRSANETFVEFAKRLNDDVTNVSISSKLSENKY